MRRAQFVFRKITSACAQIGPGVAQNVDQLERHSVALAQRQHLVFAQTRKVPSMPETKTGPEFADTTGDQISVFVQIGGGAKSPKFLRMVEELGVKHLCMRDVLFPHDSGEVCR